MGSAENGRESGTAADLLNVFALVIYIPDPLGKFLDDLRRELAPQCNPRAHVSVLPPRALPVVAEWPLAVEEARALSAAWPAFRIQATRVAVFPATDVIYLEIGAGATELRQIHAAMNTKRLEFDEPFDYHPHITLAQDMPAAELAGMRDVAAARWAEFPGDPTFLAERAVFVRNASGNRWIDLAEVSLGTVPVERL